MVRGRFRLGWVLGAGLLAWSQAVYLSALQAQTLAHKGWVGSGITVDPWWKNAVFYEVDPLLFQDSNGDGFGDLNGITQRLDYLQGLGVDVLVLSPFPLQHEANQGTAFESRYGTEDDFGRLEQEASRRKMRIMVDLPVGQSAELEETLATARFWLTRGVAGFRVREDKDFDSTQRTAALRALRKVCAGFMGERVLMAETPVAGEGDQPIPVPHGKRRRSSAVAAGDPVQLKVDEALSQAASWDVAKVRTTIFGEHATGSGEVIVSDTAQRARSWHRFGEFLPQDEGLPLAKMLAAVMFLGSAEPMLYFGQEIGMAGDPGRPSPMQWGGQPGFSSGTPWVEMGANEPATKVALEDGDNDSLLTWYRLMSKLRHDDAALHKGIVTQVETGYPDVVAWVRRGPSKKDQPVVVVCNVSGQARLISLAESLHALGLSTSYGVRALALSILGMDPSYSAAGINLPAYGVYVGELRQPGLEDAPAPVISHRHR